MKLIVLLTCIALGGCGMSGRGYVHSDVFPGLAKDLGAQAVDRAVTSTRCGQGESFTAEVETLQGETSVGLTRTAIRLNVGC